MANIGTVQSVTGLVRAIAEDGSERILSVGDSVAENEKIITGSGVIVIAFTDGTVMDLGSNSSIVLNDDVLNQEGAQAVQSRESANDEVAALQEALVNPNFDPTADLPATAAGAPAAGTTGNNGHTLTSIDYLNPEAPVESGFDTVGISNEFLQADEELPPLIGSPPEADPVLTKASNGDELPEALQAAFSELGLSDGAQALVGDVRVGYYDMSSGQGVNAQLPGILANGYVAVNVLDLSAEELTGIDVLVVQNPSNGGYGGEYLANLALIQSAVSNGLVLVIAGDRYVDGAESILPGGGEFNILRDFADSSDIDILNPDTTLINSGTADVLDDVTDTSLDGGNSSTHGFAEAGSLGDAELLLSTSDGSEVVVFSYQFGSGSVIYSTIPIDYYLNGSGPADTRAGMEQYYENLIEYAANITVEGSVDVAFYKQLTVDGLIGDSDVAVADFGGRDNETSLENLIFTLNSAPTFGSLILITAEGDTSLMLVGDTFTSVDTVYWFASDDEVAPFEGNPANVNFDYSVTDEDANVAESVVTITFPLIIPEPSIILAEQQEGPVVIDEDDSGFVTVDAQTNQGSHLTTIVITGFEGYVTAAWLELGSLSGTAVFDAATGTLTISGLTGTNYSSGFEVVPPSNDDRDAGSLTATVTAVNNVDPTLTVDAEDTALVITDAVADEVTVDINVVDSGDANTSFHIGEDGSVTVTADFADVVDGSETHTVEVTIPDGFTVADDSIANSVTVNLDGSTTLIYTVTGASLNDTFTVTNESAADGELSFDAEATAEETTFAGSEPDLSDNLETDSDSTLVVSDTAIVSFAISSTTSISEELEETATFSVTLSGDPITAGETATVDINLGAGSATDNIDYDAFEGAIITAAGGETGVNYDDVSNTLSFDSDFDGNFVFTLDAIDDDVLEVTETIIAELSNATMSNGSASISTASTSTNITNTDQAITLTIADEQVSISEEAEASDKFTITLSESINTGNTVTVDVAFTGDATAADFQVDEDAQAALQTAADATTGVSFDGSTLTFIDTFVGTTLDFTVQAKDDDLLDSPETRTVTLSNADADDGSAVVGVADSATVDITDTDQAITLTIADEQVSISEEAEASDKFTITLSESINTGNTVTVDVAFTGDATAADFQVDEDAQAALQTAADATTGVSFDGSTLTFIDTFVGTTLDFTVQAKDDDLLDSPETRTVTLSNADADDGSAVVGVADSATVDITDIDNAVSFAISVVSEDASDDTLTQQATITEENDSDDLATFTLTVSGFPLTGANLASVDIDFTGTTDGADFVTAALASLTAALPTGVSISGNTLTFDSSYDGSAINFTVEASDDGDDEGPEDLTATLSAESIDNGSVSIVGGKELATVDLLDNDAEFPAGLAYSIAGGGGTGAFLYGLDLATGATFQIGAVEVSGNEKAQFSSLTLNPNDGYLYGLADQGNLNGFVRVNAATAEAELLFSDALLNISTSGMSFDVDGNLYVGIDDDIYMVDAIDVSSINDVSDLGVAVASFDNSGVAIDSMAFYKGDGTLSDPDLIYFISGSQLYSLVVGGTTAVATPMAIGDTIDGLSFDESGNLWGADNLGNIYSIDPMTGTGTLVATISNSDVTNSGIHSLAISQLEPGTYVTLLEGAGSFTKYYQYDVIGPGVDTLDTADTGLTAHDDVTVTIVGRTVTVTQTDITNPIDAIEIRVDASAVITVDGFTQSDVFTRDGEPSHVTITDAEAGVIQTGEAADIININLGSARADSDGNVLDELFRIDTDGGDDIINLGDVVDTAYIINAGEVLDGNGNLLQDANDVDTVVIDGSVTLGGNLMLGNGIVDDADEFGNVEVLDMTGTGDNTLTLTEADVLTATDETNTLIIQGNAGDALASVDTWVAGPTNVVGVDGGVYDTYTSGLATLLVESDVSIAAITD